jgi:hypothetical protein
MTDSVAGCASVHSVTETMERGTTNAVNLLERACTCGVYQQTGIPCMHAWAVMLELEISDKLLFTDKYFHGHCFTLPLKRMFITVPQLIGKVPSTSAVEDRLHHETFQTVRAQLVANKGSSRSSKRITSSGEGAGPSSVSAQAHNKSKRQCGICLEMFAKRTVHPPSACETVCRRKEIIYPKRRKCPTIDESADGTVDDGDGKGACNI